MFALGRERAPGKREGSPGLRQEAGSIATPRPHTSPAVARSLLRPRNQECSSERNPPRPQTLPFRVGMGGVGAGEGAVQSQVGVAHLHTCLGHRHRLSSLSSHCSHSNLRVENNMCVPHPPHAHTCALCTSLAPMAPHSLRPGHHGHECLQAAPAQDPANINTA